MKVNIGDKLRDNDKRQKGRIVTITDIWTFGADATDPNVCTDFFIARYHTGKREAGIRFDRIFTDGKKRQRGFNLVK